MTEKQMTDEELAQKIDDLYYERSRQIIPASVSVQQEHHRHTLKMITDLISEARKGMFTEEEVREWIGRAIASRTLTYALKEFEQYLTERKGG